MSKEMEAMWATMSAIEFELPPAGLLVPHEFVVSPSDELRSRSCSKEHVDDIVESLMHFGLQPTTYQLHAVVVDNYLRDLFVANRLTLNHLLQRLQTGECKLQIIVGDHRQQALKIATTLAPNNVSFQKTPIGKVFIIPKYSPFVSTIRMYGDSDNRITSLHKATSSHDLIDLMRKGYLELVEGKQKMDPRAACTSIRAQWRLMLASQGRGSRSNVSMYSEIAFRPKEQYELLYKIMAGGIMTATGKRTNPVRQAAWFTQGIPTMQDDVITAFLAEVASGDASTKDFTNNCRKYRSKVMVEERIIDTIHAQSGRPFKDMLLTIAAIRKHYPRYDTEFGESFWNHVRQPGWVWRNNVASIEISTDAAQEIVSKCRMVVNSALAKVQPVSSFLFLNA